MDEIEHTQDPELTQKATVALEEQGAARAWLKRIEDARTFDKPAREGYAADRALCQGTAHKDVFDVRVPIAGTYVNILTSFLYARDPEVSVELAEAVSPRGKEDARAFSSALEIVISRLWKQARLKASADAMVRSGLTVGIGWLKAAWHAAQPPEPVTGQDNQTPQAQVSAIGQLQQTLQEGTVADGAPQQEELQQRFAALQQEVQAEPEPGRLCIDFVRAEDVQVAPECASLTDYLDAPWMAQRLFLPLDEAKALYPEAAPWLHQATAYYRQSDESQPADGWAAASSGSGASFGTHDSANTGRPCVCIWEVWDKTTGHVLTLAEGLNRWLRPAFIPAQKTTRFYPFFQWAVNWNDGARHPQSLPDRSRPLLEEYDRIRSNYRLHRRRAIPKTGFDKGKVTPEDAARLEAGVSNEMIGLDLLGNEPQNVIFPISYNPIDPALYDTEVIRQELEMIWGIQEALSSTIRTVKTATEADIQQQGTESRLGYARDGLDETLSDLAKHTAELAVSTAGLDPMQAQVLAGQEALWVNVPDPRLLDTVVTVDIRAGSSGKPSTSLKQQQWSVLLPQLQQAALQIGQMRMCPPWEIAACLEQLAVETVRRTGDTSIDPYSFIPQPPAQPFIPPEMGAVPPPPDAPPMPPPDDTP